MNNIILPFTVFIASFLGSSHCASMCGGLVAFFNPSIKEKIFYNIGRLFSYTLLGGLLGLITDKVLIGLVVFPLQFIFLVTLFLFFLVTGFLQIYGHKTKFKPLNKVLTNLSKVNLTLYGVMPYRWLKALCLGFFSILLPCGWLYFFAFSSALSKGFTSGALTMALFWLGTIPAIISASTFISVLKNKLGIYAPRIASAMIVVIGGISLIVYARQLSKSQHVDMHRSNKIDLECHW